MDVFGSWGKEVILGWNKEDRVFIVGATMGSRIGICRSEEVSMWEPFDRKIELV